MDACCCSIVCSGSLQFYIPCPRLKTGPVSKSGAGLLLHPPIKIYLKWSKNINISWQKYLIHNTPSRVRRGVTTKYSRVTLPPLSGTCGDFLVKVLGSWRESWCPGHLIWSTGHIWSIYNGCHLTLCPNIRGVDDTIMPPCVYPCTPCSLIHHLFDINVILHYIVM